jgi:hypothetical protein
MSTPPLETARRTQWVNPPAFDFEAGPGREVLPPSVQVPAPDHLAVIRPPAAARLTARPPASARSTTAPDACASSRRRAPALFRLPDAPSIGFLWRPFRRPFPRPTSGLVPETPDPGSLRARQCQAAILRDPDAFHRMGSDRALSREPSRRADPAGPEQVAARVHRCAKTPARPHLAPLSRCESRPRAPLRILQVDVPTSTTTDHPNILIRGIRGRDDCHARFRKFPSFFGAAAGGAQGQGPGQPMPGIPGNDCSRRRLRPNPDRSGHLVSRDASSRRSGATR